MMSKQERSIENSNKIIEKKNPTKKNRFVSLPQKLYDRIASPINILHLMMKT